MKTHRTTDDRIVTILKSVDIPNPSPEAKERCIDAAKTAYKIHPNEGNFLHMLLVQVSYMKKSLEMVVMLLILLVGATAIITIYPDIAKSLNNYRLESDFTNILVTMAAYFVIPLGTSLHKSHRYNMSELEASCKYNLPKLLASRLFICTITAVSGIIFLWLALGLYINALTTSGLLAALISLNISCFLFLFLGKKSFINGFLGAVLWASVTTIGALYGKTAVIVFSLNLVTVFITLIITAAVFLWASIRFIKYITFEEESNKWNFI